MNKSRFLAVLATFVGCLMAFPSSAQTAPEQQIVAATANPTGESVAPVVTSSPKIPVLASVYSGRWEAVNTVGGTNSNTTNFKVTSQFQLDEKTGGYVAKGTYTTYPTGNGYNPCGTLVDIPMVIRWFPFESQSFNLVATPTDKACPSRRFKLIQEMPSGRMTWKRADGQQSVYFDPDTSG